jgi:hypothetical protein
MSVRLRTWSARELEWAKSHKLASTKILGLDLKASSKYTICSSGVREAGENPALPRNCKRGEIEK